MESSPKISIKLIQGLRVLSDNELNDFYIFALSKYFSKDREYSRIIKQLIELHKSNYNNLDNKSFLKFLSEKLNMNKQSILNRISELYKIYEMYIIIKKYENDSYSRNFTLSEIYLEKRAHKLFDYTYNSLKKISSDKKFDNEMLDRYFQIEGRAALNFFFTNRYDEFFELYSSKSVYLVGSFLQNMLRYSMEAFQQRTIDLNPRTELVDQVIDKIDFGKILNTFKKYDPFVSKYLMLQYKLFLSFKDFSKTEPFYEARKIHKEIKNKLTYTENHQTYFVLTTYCINQTNFKQLEFYQELFEIIDEKLNEGYYAELKENNKPVNNFRDYIIIALYLGEIKWIKSFIKKFSQYLPPEIRNDEINVGWGIVALEESEYEKAVEYFKNVKKKNYVHYIDSGLYKLRAFYKLKMFYEAFAEIDRLRQYLNYHKRLPSFYKKGFTVQLNDLVMLIRYGDNQISLNELKFYFKDFNYYSKKNWLSKELITLFKK